MKKALVGVARNPHDQKGYPVVAYEFADTPGYYQFYVLSGFGHWRAFPKENASLAEIPYKVAVELKEAIRAATVEPWLRETKEAK